MIKEFNLHPELRSQINPIPRRALHVAKADAGNVDYLYDNVPYGRLFHTIASALAVSQVYDDIYIWPGTYAESITDALTNLRLMGVGGWGEVTVAPVSSNGYVGAVTDSVVSGIQWLEPSAAGGTAAFAATSLRGSTIADCLFTGKTGNVASVGLRIGAETSVASEAMFQSTITRCLFDASGGRTKEWAYGICMGPTGASTDSDTRVFAYSEISYNTIYAEERGISLKIDAANGGGVIKNNIIGSRQNSGQTSTYGIEAAGDSTDLLTKILDNRIAAGSDAIVGFTTGNVMGNIVSVGAGAPTSETGQ
ncbi:hypothetical protein LCGC14_1641060 [marine sediment metagenome]|uniref:Right handed beta helix domain-containing protein n=1 Tax=marine sediment metagenome TaxID=412755 RepID=A0A0F9I085_9ZZZZ